MLPVRSALAVFLFAMALPLAARAPLPPPVHGSTQVIVVVTNGWDDPHGQLQAWQRSGDGDWQAHGEAFAVTVGRSGSAWGVGRHPEQTEGPQKREGDGRSPAGVFDIGTAFGYADTATTALPYQPMRDTSYCMDVPDSPYYNRIVDADVVGAEAVEGSTEPMRLDLHKDGNQRYRQGFVIDHNPRSVPRLGSCIFAHLWGGPGEPTAGCTAMQPEHMQALLGWLRPDARPRFVLLPRAQYQQLQARWTLPPLAPAAP